ncbi:methionine--tRNA ligase subunit beta [Tunturibacter empetritectus]|uniref:Methionine--tRNA ligase n=1 Tax=Tunturiibacter empetritectus TaxID=3069691 RepID=A0A7W8MQG3_9BACT|nr:methionine--tRNA ligase subunit beta [Edaphobacter lichenicola]MBB5316691.1 methionyl-tRNA synthetase [Edaphobacter lichenicola]
MPEQKFYLTTPIYYVNARPHIGHAYSTLAADVIARRHRLLGEDTFFLTGTDEHGQKIERSAAAAGIAPQQFTDQVSAEFRTLWDRMGLTYDDYIRTTEPRHQRGVQRLFADLHQRGQIYLSTYTGQYSIGEEIFVDGPPGVLGPDGKPTETVTEENFFFKLSEYQLPLIDLIESDTFLIQPESRKNEVLSFLRGDVKGFVSAAYDRALFEQTDDVSSRPTPFNLPADPLRNAEEDGKIGRTALGNRYVKGHLRDLSVSRSSFTWGIPVPEPAASETTQKHVIYVWLDALANYMTAVGYGSDAPEDVAKFEKYWPANLHLMAKEITRQHCIYWPAFLLAAGLPLPKAVTAHGWLLFDDSKMSKSKGNIVRTETILDAFGTLCPPISAQPESPRPPTKAEQDLFATDVLRYFLLREIPFGQDGSFSFEAMITRYNADLANGYGNLVSRTLSMIARFCSSANVMGRLSGASVPPLRTLHDESHIRFYPEISSLSETTARSFGQTFNSFDLAKSLESVWILIARTDSFISETSPWKLLKEVATAQNLETLETLTPEHAAALVRVEGILYTAAESIRIITALLYPVLPYATAKVWAQLGLGDIEVATRNGELKNLEWGGLKPSTKLGPLAPIFPRADKGLAQIMIDMENPSAPKPEQPTPSRFVDETTTHTAPVPTDPTHPGAPPRTFALGGAAPGMTVAGSLAISTERTGTPSHTEAPASGIFANSAAQSSLSGTAPDTPQIAIDDFVKIDLRVAQIVVAERIPKADKLLRLEVDLGYEKRQILSGIAEWYTPEELIGKKIVVIANLAPRKMRGLESHGMLLAASHGEDGKPVLATFGEEIALGSRLK